MLDELYPQHDVFKAETSIMKCITNASTSNLVCMNMFKALSGGGFPVGRMLKQLAEQP